MFNNKRNTLISKSTKTKCFKTKKQKIVAFTHSNTTTGKKYRKKENNIAADPTKPAQYNNNLQRPVTIAATLRQHRRTRKRHRNRFIEKLKQIN
jgi:hypothetical protein